MLERALVLNCMFIMNTVLFPGQVDEVLLSGLFQFVKTVDKVLIWLLFTDDTGLAMVVAIVSDSGDKRLVKHVPTLR